MTGRLGRIAPWLLVALLLLTGGASGAGQVISGRFWSTAPTATRNGQAVDLRLASDGSMVTVMGGTSSGIALICSGTTTAKTADFAGYGATTDLKLYGYGVAENAGAAASIRLRHGTTDSDQPIGPLIQLASGETLPWVEYERPIDVSSGLFVEVVSGSVEFIAAAATD